MTFGQEIIAEARTLEGIKYKDKGRDEYGLDCAGVLSLVARRKSIPHYDTTNYARRPDPVELMRGLNRSKVLELRRNKWDWCTGDIGVFSTHSHPVHLGFLERDEQGKEFVIHAWAPAKRVIRTEVNREVLEHDPDMKLRRVYRVKV